MVCNLDDVSVKVRLAIQSCYHTPLNFIEAPAEEVEEDEEDETLERYDPNPGEVKEWRKDLADGLKKHKKRKAKELKKEANVIFQARYSN